MIIYLWAALSLLSILAPGFVLFGALYLFARWRETR